MDEVAAGVNDNGGHGGAAVDADGQAESNVAVVEDVNVAVAAVHEANVAAAVDDGNVAAAAVHEANGKGQQKKSNAGSDCTPSASGARRSNRFRSATGSTSQPPTRTGGRRPNKGVAATMVLGSQASSSNPS
ncbi:hypothetical protein DEO72_LG10g884 [Vigna unguiculata]|uniref:Uncharacterized protein n=1 Tax=Vigna unguiculata TaxID=3917 RepID=A0A4D6N755_VIGUN|nr:hypothetical protein DEO72_LG10g884 [Vigna unguiculata]